MSPAEAPRRSASIARRGPARKSYDSLVRALWHMYRLGAEAAAAHASSYDASTTHDYQLRDAILYKMNLSQGKPRRNDRRLRHPDVSWVLGFASALAEVARFGVDSSTIQRVARDAGVTLAELRRSGLLPGPLASLRRAGVPEGTVTAGGQRRRGRR